MGVTVHSTMVYTRWELGELPCGGAEGVRSPPHTRRALNCMSPKSFIQSLTYTHHYGRLWVAPHSLHPRDERLSV
jgi:hypothetical protein